MGYLVFTASTGAAGLHLFLHNDVDLVISDQVLQDPPGARLIDEMKRIKPRVPFLMLSGLQDSPEGAEHADLFLTKGMAPTELLAGISKLLEHKPLREAALQSRPTMS